MFAIDSKYTKRDIYNILSVPSKIQKGAWDTGYREYQGNIYLFANIGMPGRTGSDYNNYWDGDLFHWEAKTNSKLSHPLIKKMLLKSNSQNVFLFTRTDNYQPFIYEGTVYAIDAVDAKPVKVIWGFCNSTENATDDNLLEGAGRQITTNKYERNPLARRICIEHYGCHCIVCDFDFNKSYGEFGKNYIHVHHVIPLSAIGHEYSVDPIKDLVPICPNCHSMIHRRRLAISIAELKNKLNIF